MEIALNSDSMVFHERLLPTELRTVLDALELLSVDDSIDHRIVFIAAVPICVPGGPSVPAAGEVSIHAQTLDGKHGQIGPKPLLFTLLLLHAPIPLSFGRRCCIAQTEIQPVIVAAILEHPPVRTAHRQTHPGQDVRLQGDRRDIAGIHVIFPDIIPVTFIRRERSPDAEPAVPELRANVVLTMEAAALNILVYVYPFKKRLRQVVNLLARMTKAIVRMEPTNVRFARADEHDTGSRIRSPLGDGLGAFQHADAFTVAGRDHREVPNPHAVHHIYRLHGLIESGAADIYGRRRPGIRRRRGNDDARLPVKQFHRIPRHRLHGQRVRALRQRADAGQRHEKSCVYARFHCFFIINQILQRYDI